MPFRERAGLLAAGDGRPARLFLGPDSRGSRALSEGAKVVRGADHFGIAWRLTAAGWLGCALLQLLLYLRPSPYGGPFLVQWKVFIIRPLVYELLSTWLIALPFLLLWLVL